MSFEKPNLENTNSKKMKLKKINLEQSFAAPFCSSQTFTFHLSTFQFFTFDRFAFDRFTFDLPPFTRCAPGGSHAVSSR